MIIIRKIPLVFLIMVLITFGYFAIGICDSPYPGCKDFAKLQITVKDSRNSSPIQGAQVSVGRTFSRNLDARTETTLSCSTSGDVGTGTTNGHGVATFHELSSFYQGYSLSVCVSISGYNPKLVTDVTIPSGCGNSGYAVVFLDREGNDNYSMRYDGNRGTSETFRDLWDYSKGVRLSGCGSVVNEEGRVSSSAEEDKTKYALWINGTSSVKISLNYSCQKSGPYAAIVNIHAAVEGNYDYRSGVMEKYKVANQKKYSWQSINGRQGLSYSLEQAIIQACECE